MALEDLSQRQRFWLFIVLAVSFMVLWGIFNPFRPPPKDPQAQNAQQAADKKAPDQPVKPGEQPAQAPDQPGKPPEKPAAEVRPTVNAAEQLKQLDALLAKLPDEEHELGNENSKIRVVLSGRGAAIRRVTLNDYEASDRMTGQRLPANGGKAPRFTLLTDDEDGNRKELSLSSQFDQLSYRLALVVENDQSPPELAALTWKKEPGSNSTRVAYSAEVPSRNLRIIKTYTLNNDQYHVGLELSYAKLDAAKPAEFSYVLTGPRGVPVEGLRWKQFSFRHAVFVTQDPETKTLTRTMEGSERFFVNKNPNTHMMTDPKSPRVFLYAGVMIQFFASLAVVDHQPGESPPRHVEKVITESVGPDADAPEFYAPMQGRFSTRLISSKVKVEQAAVTHKYLLYAGPSKALMLKFENGVAPDLYKVYGEHYQLSQLTDASDVAFTSFFQRTGITGLLVASTNMMHHLLEWLYSICRNYGIAIILMTVIVRLILFPLSRKQALNQAKMQERMKVLRPEMEKLKKQFGNDRQAYGIAQLELMKKHNMSPFAGCSGCWILLAQMPIFLGLYFALRESVHLRLSGFLWIDNLAMPDMLVYWSDNFLTNIWFHLIGMRVTMFYLGPYLHILPIISVTLMYIYQKVMTPPAMDEQQEQQMKMMNYMTLIFGMLFYWVASGLCLYFIVSSAWGMVERRFTKKAKDRVIAQLNRKPDDDEKSGGDRRGPGTKPKEGGGIKGKLGNYWRDLQAKADKRT
jgi:YidC/Oxa1 family membrane protein insertase